MLPKRKRRKIFTPVHRAEVKLKTIKPAMDWLVKINKLSLAKRTVIRSLMIQRKILPSAEILEKQAIALYRHQQTIKFGFGQEIAITAREQVAILRNLKKFLSVVDYAKKQSFIK